MPVSGSSAPAPAVPGIFSRRAAPACANSIRNARAHRMRRSLNLPCGNASQKLERRGVFSAGRKQSRAQRDHLHLSSAAALGALGGAQFALGLRACHCTAGAKHRSHARALQRQACSASRIAHAACVWPQPARASACCMGSRTLAGASAKRARCQLIFVIGQSKAGKRRGFSTPPTPVRHSSSGARRAGRALQARLHASA